MNHTERSLLTFNKGNELTVKTTLNDIDKCFDKHGNLYFKIQAQWGLNRQTLYAFANDFQLDKNTLENLRNSPENLINRLVLIAYQIQPNLTTQGTFYKVKKIELVI